MYGSRDGGRTIHNSDQSVDASMKQLAHKLNLKVFFDYYAPMVWRHPKVNPSSKSLSLSPPPPHIHTQQHVVGNPAQGTAKTVCLPADIEVHKGHDGMTYMLDYSRMMPPEAP